MQRNIEDDPEVELPEEQNINHLKETAKSIETKRIL